MIHHPVKSVHWTQVSSRLSPWKLRLDKLYAWLMTPIHASTLGLFRIVYSYVMLAQIMKWATMFASLSTSVYVFPYPGISWVHPLSPAMGNTVLAICFISSISLGLGFMTKVASVVNYLTFAYLFHICQSYYNNHYVLMCHINFVTCFISWNTWGSIDTFLKKRAGKRVEQTVPYWHLMLMQLLFCIPYFFGGIAKMNPDWLFRAQPIIDWFSSRPGWVYRQWWFPWFISWSGMLFDLTISFFLMYPKTRYLIGFPGALSFNLGNRLMFNIGVFPFAMVASLVLLLDPKLPQRLWHNIFVQSCTPKITMEKTESISGTHEEEIKYKQRSRVPWHKWYVLIFVGSFVIFHSLYPLRHFVMFKSTPSWTEEGHIGAWHMKLRSKRGWTVLECEEMDGKITTLVPRYDPFITRSQVSKVNNRPHVLLHYVEKLQYVFQEAKRPLKSVKIHSCQSLNSNPYRLLFVPTANALDYVGKYEFVSTTGIGLWINTHEDAPRCDPMKAYQEYEALKESSLADYKLLYKQADIHAGTTYDSDNYRYRMFVYHNTDRGDGGKYKQPAYMWKA